MNAEDQDQLANVPAENAGEVADTKLEEAENAGVEESASDNDDQLDADEAAKSDEHADEQEELDAEDAPKKPRGRNRKLQREISDLKDSFKAENEAMRQTIADLTQHLGGKQEPVQVRNYEAERYNKEILGLIQEDPYLTKRFGAKDHPLNHFDDMFYDMVVKAGEDPNTLLKIGKKYEDELLGVMGSTAKSQYAMYQVLKGKMKRSKSEVADRIKNTPKVTGVVRGSKTAGKPNTMEGRIAALRKGK